MLVRQRVEQRVHAAGVRHVLRRQHQANRRAPNGSLPPCRFARSYDQTARRKQNNRNVSSLPTRLIAIALTSNAQKNDATTATASPTRNCATPKSTSVIAAPAMAYGSRIAVSGASRNSDG